MIQPVAKLGAVAAVVLASVPIQAGPLDPGARICLQRPWLPIQDSTVDPRTTDLEARLTKALQAAGFEVPEPAAVDTAIERAVEPLAGSIDPFTGRRDPARDAARQAAIAQALRELDCDARMLAEVIPVWVYFNNGFAKWDGRSQRVSSGDRIALQVIGGIQEFSHVRALSLWLRVLDLEGTEIAFRSAGIEAIFQLTATGDDGPLPQEQWLTTTEQLDSAIRSTERLDSAIRSALGERGERLRRAELARPN